MTFQFSAFNQREAAQVRAGVREDLAMKFNISASGNQPYFYIIIIIINS